MSGRTTSAGTAQTGPHLMKLRADLAAKQRDSKRLNPNRPDMVMAGELGFLDARAERMARDLDALELSLRANVPVGHSKCASTFGGKHCVLEYGTYADNAGKACIELFAVWLKGERYEFGEEEIADAQHKAWEKACETAEGWHNAGQDWPDVEPFDQWVDSVEAASAAEDRYTAARDHAHYARAA